MVQTLSQSDDLEFETAEALAGSPFEVNYDPDASKPFRGIMIGLAIVTPIWCVIGVILYFIL
jgi:hypothetical protein